MGSSAGARVGTFFGWLGGGQNESLTSSERSGYQLAGALVLLNVLLTWLVATAAIASSVSASVWLIAPFTLVLGLIVGAVSRSLATGRNAGWQSLVGRALVAVFIGIVVGELAAVSLFSGTVDRTLDAAAARQAAGTPAVAQAAKAVDDLKASRAQLDASVNDDRRYVDQLLVIARCEANPTSPACPQQKITGVPGNGPETQTANQRLDAAQANLTKAEQTRTQLAPGMDADIAAAQQKLDAATAQASRDSDRSLGARWSAMHDYTTAHGGALLSRFATILLFILLIALPLIQRLWRGETELDRREHARAQRHQAEEDADTAIAVKQAEVRAAVETLWAEQQLERAKLAAETQTAIEREEHRRRVADALGTSDEDDAVAAIPARVRAALPAPGKNAPTKNLPAPLPAKKPARRGPLSVIPNVIPVPEPIVTISNAATDAATRIVTPFVPPIVAKAFRFRTTSSARSEVEEVEEITYSYKRTRKDSHSMDHTEEAGHDEPLVDESVAEHVTGQPRFYDAIEGESTSLGEIEGGPEDFSRAVGGRRRSALSGRRGPRELPPAE